ncbi:MAG: GxxExxY protein [Proteobacteria bacterium]|nr:GxxExxY protein [Pseudomonadota bacterium]
MEKEDVTHKVIGCAYQVYNYLGFGFLESVYRKAIVIEIEASGLRVQQESLSAKRLRVLGRSSRAV